MYRPAGVEIHVLQTALATPQSGVIETQLVQPQLPPPGLPPIQTPSQQQSSGGSIVR
jgi:hypothetical protein